jgi:hypothetical protein
MAKPQRPDNALIGAAGVFYVASELSLRGLVALPTIKQTRAYDLIVTSADGKHHANIQVKTCGKKTNFWPTPAPEKIPTGPNDYYALVHRVEGRFEAFLLASSEAKSTVEQVCKDCEERKKKLFPNIWIGESTGPRWKQQWDTWKGEPLPEAKVQGALAGASL